MSDIDEVDPFATYVVPKVSRVERWRRRIRDAPENIRLASQSAWRGRERGLAVVAGVFLASLVITTVFSYGIGLSQIFFDESLDGEPIDAKVEFKKAPTPETSGWTNNTSVMQDVCQELMTEYSQELADCTVILGRQGIHSAGFFNEDFLYAQPLEMRSIVDNENPYWVNTTFEYPELREAGPPISTYRSIRLMGPGAFDGEFAERYGASIIQGQGEWPNPQNMSDQRGVILPANIASQAKANVGDILDEITFVYVVDSEFFDTGGVELVESCPGEASASENGKIYCRMPMTITNMKVLGIYQPWDLGNPTLGPNPIFTTWTVLSDEQAAILMEKDHIYLGLAVDRSQLPTSSTADASDWLDNLKVSIMASNYTSSEIELFYTDIVGGTITFLDIFLGFIQIFDYVIMVPIVVMSLAVLVYGLILSLEQRRKEISIHRVIGADSRGLQGMVLLELAVFASVAWLAGYLLAMFAVPIVLSAVGFMQFKSGNYNIDPTLSFGATLFTALSTLGLALLFGRKRAREFIDLEIEEGVKNTTAKPEPKYWLHWTCFVLGFISVIDTWMEMNGSEDGIIQNFFLEGLFGIFGPFLLWIGGALVLGRLGAKGPQIMQVIFGRTKILSDVKRGLKGSGSAESVNRLAVIMLLTLSIVTLAAVQGYTGSLVDERTVDARVGSDLQITFEEPYNESTAVSIVQEIYRSDTGVKATTIPSLVLKGPDGDYIQTYVVLDNADDVLNWNQQAIPGKSVSQALQRYADGGFSAGEDSAFTLDLAGSWSSSKALDDILIGESDDRSVTVLMDYETLRLNFSAVNDSNVSDDAEIDWEEALLAYSALMTTDLSGVDFSGQDLSYRDFGRMDFTNANLSGADLSGANLSEALFFRTDLSSANLAGANLTNAVIVEWFGGSLDNADFTEATLTGMYGTADASNVVLENTTCASGNLSENSVCDEFTTFLPTPLAVPILLTESPVQIERTSVNSSIKYMGLHEFIPGVNSSIIADSLVIGESSWRSFVGDVIVDNYSTNNWIMRVDGVSGDSLKALGSQLEADSRIGEVIDWKTEHESVERNGGLIFGTPGLLSLQFVVASIAAVASSFVFLSLVLNQRKKELAVLQAIGASPTQILRLVLFEILSIIVVSMLLGLILGIGLAFSFNGFFDVFGFIFQLFGGASTNISRELVYPWFELTLVSVSVFTAVVIALLLTTRRALNSDLAMVLKGE